MLINPISRPEEPPLAFPLGLAYIAKVLLEDGLDVEVLDFNALRLSQAEAKAKISEITFDVVGITGMITEFNEVDWICKYIGTQNKNCTIILGGGLASVSPEIVLANLNVDVVVIGEGEETVRELANAIKNNRRELSSIKGISFKKDNKIIHNPTRESIQNLDSIPFPARDLFLVDVYLKEVKISNWMFGRECKMLNIISSRGCPYHCIYCDHSIWGHKFRQRSPENIIKELKVLKEKYQIEAFNFVDDIFLLDRKFVFTFCDLLTKENMGLYWMCNVRASLVDGEILEKLKESGCTTLGFGIESLSDKILKEMNKGVTAKQQMRALRLSQKHGFRLLTYSMIGMFNETEKTALETLKNYRRLGITTSFSFVTPIINTPLYKEAKKRGKIEIPELEMLRKWGNWNNNLVVNLTNNLSTEELILLKKRLEQELHIPQGYKWRNIYALLQRTLTHYKKKGLVSTVKKIYKKLNRNQMIK
ncbi:radical SAM protein [bacterium]|nr:radical SAM protein [bacterium]